MQLSEYRNMWLIAMFDLPTDTPRARKAYVSFRKALLKDGFTMMQFSVYLRYCASEENTEVHVKRAIAALPPDGEVRLLRVTDKQFERMQVFWGKMRKPAEKPPQQLQLF